MGQGQVLTPICLCSGFRRFMKVLMPPTVLVLGRAFFEFSEKRRTMPRLALVVLARVATSSVALAQARSTRFWNLTRDIISEFYQGGAITFGTPISAEIYHPMLSAVWCRLRPAHPPTPSVGSSRSRRPRAGNCSSRNRPGAVQTLAGAEVLKQAAERTGWASILRRSQTLP